MEGSIQANTGSQGGIQTNVKTGKEASTVGKHRQPGRHSDKRKDREGGIYCRQTDRQVKRR